MIFNPANPLDAAFHGVQNRNFLLPIVSEPHLAKRKQSIIFAGSQFSGPSIGLPRNAPTMRPLRRSVAGERNRFGAVIFGLIWGEC